MKLKQTSSILVSALLAFGATQACSSDDTSTPQPSAGSGGALAGAAGAAVAGGGSTSAGAGGAPAAGAGGTTAGAGGSVAGTGGSSGGASGGAGGAAPASFGAVKAIFAAHCGVGACHSPDGGPHLNYHQVDNLYTVLTTPIPSTVPYCQGTKVVDGTANSFLLKVVAGTSMCGNQTVPQMPEGCQPGDAQRPCLTAAQIKTISDWIAAGAKND